jgi:hypothetical protein
VGAHRDGLGRSEQRAGERCPDRGRTRLRGSERVARPDRAARLNIRIALALWLVFISAGIISVILADHLY